MYPCKYKVKRTSMGSPSVKVKTYLRRQKEGPAIRKMLRMTEKRAMDATRVFFLLEERGEGGGGAPHG